MANYKIKSVSANKCLNIYGDNVTTLNNHQNICLWADSGTDEQKWSITSLESGVFVRSVINTNFGFNVYRSGSPWNCDLYPISGNEIDAKVNFIKSGDNYKIQLANYTGYYLTAGGTGDGSNVYWATNTGGNNQLWACTVVNDSGPSPTAKIIDAPYIYQKVKYPNGCESVSTVMALQHMGVNISVDTFIDNYLDMGATPVVGGTGPDPDVVFCGNPRLTSGWGCYSPVIKKALAKFIDTSKYTYTQAYDKSLSELCHTYIDNNIPVIIWGTLNMMDSSASSYYATWTTPGGKKISYNKCLHCLLLVGYDENNYYFNDPLRMNSNGVKYTAYSKASTEKAYSILNKQSIVIKHK